MKVPLDCRKILSCILLPGFQHEKGSGWNPPSLRLPSNTTSPINLSLTALTQTSSHFRPLTCSGKSAPSSQLSLGLYPHIPRMAIRHVWVGGHKFLIISYHFPLEGKKNIIQAPLN